MTPEQANLVIERFSAVCRRYDLVVAAFLGGSWAAGTATASSDIDFYVICDEEHYLAFFAGRVPFVRAWADQPRLTDHLNYEGLGFDLMTFDCPDGVWGQIAFGHTGNFMRLHGGPHVVLVDKRGLLEGVEFPLL